MNEKMVALTQGEIEMQSLPLSPVSKFQQNLPTLKKDAQWIEKWLQGEYVGETNAVASMEALLKTFRDQPQEGKRALLIERIISDEKKHVTLIGQLLLSRGIAPRPPEKAEVLRGLDSWNKGCAIASRAEAVRAGEIRM